MAGFGPCHSAGVSIDCLVLSHYLTSIVFFFRVYCAMEP